MKYLIIIAALALSSCTTTQVEAQSKDKRAEKSLNKEGFSTMNAKVLASNKTAIANKEQRLVDAYKSLIKDADKALRFDAVTVMSKKQIPPSGDKHDYMSLAPYWWPDSSKADGLPYIRKDGKTNPEVKDFQDKDDMPKMVKMVDALALAYYFSENDAYAQHAAKLIRVWFLDEATKMNPNLTYAQAIKGRNDGRGAGLIDTRHFIRIVDNIALIKNSKYWTKEDQAKMQNWALQFLNWMQTSKEGTDEMKAKNNHGSWYDAQRLSFAIYLDSLDLAKRIIDHAGQRLDKQMDDKGFFPAEMERTISLHYSAFVMNALVNIAQMADKVGVDFWSYTTPSGKSLEKGFTALRPYFSNEKAWEGEQIKDYDWEDGYPILLEGKKHYKCRGCADVVTTLAGDKAPRLRINLLY